MGNSSSNSSEVPKQSHSCDKVEERQRLRATIGGVRNDYFHKLVQSNKTQNVERTNVKKKNLRQNVSIYGVKVEKGQQDDLISDLEGEGHYTNFNNSCQGKDLNISMLDSLMKSNTQSMISNYDVNLEKENIGNINLEGSINKIKIKNIFQNSKKYSNTDGKKIRTKRISLSNFEDKFIGSKLTNDVESFSETKNTLFLNNELLNGCENEFLNNFDDSSKNANMSKDDNTQEVSQEDSKCPNLFNIESKRKNKFASGHLISLNLLEETLQTNNNSIFPSERISIANSQLKDVNNDYELAYVKNGEELRKSYIAKLIYKKIWPPSVKEKDHNTVIIFDWDDTLLCTSFLTPNGVFNEDMEYNEKDTVKIAKLEFSALRILTNAIEKGDTYIITNAAPGWVEYSSEKFYPSVRKILNKVKIISARGDYERQFPGDSRMWKIQAFLNMQKNFDNNLVTNIICLGDSFIEMEAGHVLASKFSQAFIKTIKFRESPKPEELNKQLSLVADQFPAIFSAIKNLTIRVEKKAKR